MQFYRYLSIAFLVLTGVQAYGLQDEGLVFGSVGKTVDYYGTEKFSQLLGYSAFFPGEIGQGYRLEAVSLGLGLSRKVSTETLKLLEQDMNAGIEDNAALAKLKDYVPYRNAGVFYSDTNAQKTLVVATLPTVQYAIVENPDMLSEEYRLSSVSFTEDGTLYCWREFKNPADASAMLSWQIDTVTYMVFAIHGQISKQEALDISKKILEFYRSRKS